MKKDKVTRGQTAGEATRKMKLTVPLFEGLGIRPHLRQLLTNYIVHHCFKAKQPVTVVRGTSVREVSEQRLLNERRILEEADMSRPAQVDAALR